MEHIHLVGDTPIPPRQIECWLDVDTKVIYTNNQPVGVWFRYYDNNHQIVEQVIPVTPDTDINSIYGGLMAWEGRYQQVAGVLVLIAVKFGDEWHNLA